MSRRNFKCRFNDRVTPDNRDGVIRSLIAQFEGLYGDPEITLENDGFILSLELGDHLTPTLVRDKIAWNYFIDTVSVAESIRKIKVMRLPTAERQELGAGQLDGIERGAVVDGEVVDGQGESEYKIDMGDRPDGPLVKNRRTPAVFGLGMSRGGTVHPSLKTSSLHYADPGSLRNEGQAFTQDPDDVIGPQDLDSKATKVDELPAVFQTRKKSFNSRYAEIDAGGSQFGQPFDKKTELDSVDRAPVETRGPADLKRSGDGPTIDNTGTGLDSATNSWFSEVGQESTVPTKNKGPFDFFASKILEDEELKSSQDLPGTAQFGTGNTDDNGNTILQDSWGNRFSALTFLADNDYDDENDREEEDDEF